MRIISVKQLRTGFYEVRYEIDETESIFLKFKHNPTAVEINEAVNTLVATREEEQNLESMRKSAEEFLADLEDG